MTSPGFPHEVGGVRLQRLRETERRAPGAQETWKVTGQGSVGGQSLTGIPYLLNLVTHPGLAEYSHVWPFTTGFGDPTEGRAEGPLVIHAEVFPNAVPEHSYVDRMPADLPDVPDAKESWRLAYHALCLDECGQLKAAFAAPDGATQSTLDTAVAEEGWILFT